MGIVLKRNLTFASSRLCVLCALTIKKAQAYKLKHKGAKTKK